MNKSLCISLTLVVLGTSIGSTPRQASGMIEIPTTPIRHPGNQPHQRPFPLATPVGAVGYIYNIGDTEITIGQYVNFLNSVASNDNNGLYHPVMEGQYNVGIIRSGTNGSYTYSAIPGREDYPVAYVTFWNAARFANWLHNGQPTGPQNSTTTEDGAYTLTADGIANNTVTRKAGWKWALPTQDEWYKAAYYQPTTDGGDSDGYWQYPNSNNFIITTEANFGNSYGYSRQVRSYAANYYGVHDLAGNVWEWNESRDPNTSWSRGIGGGDYLSFEDDDLTSELVWYSHPTNWGIGPVSTYGIRVVRRAVAPCPGDFDASRMVEVGDIFAFLNAWFTEFGTCLMNCGADVDADNDVDVGDIFAFLNDWFSGFGLPCP